MKSTLMLLVLLGLSFQDVLGNGTVCSRYPTGTQICGRQDTDGEPITGVLDSLISGFAICNSDKGDGGLTLEELHADICQDFIASVGDADAAEYNFEIFDSNADGVVTLKEFLDLAE